MYNIGRYLLVFLVSFQVYAYEFRHFTLNPRIKSKSISHPSILKDLTEYMQANYEEIGNEQFQRLRENHDLGGGVLNFSGFTWYKPMVNYDIKAHRELAPHLESDQWIVQDTLTIFIEAATLLKNLADMEIITITPAQLEAFAGLTFKRKYHYYHFAPTYLDGLGSDYSKLFLSFLKYHPEGIFDLSVNEVMKKSDLFTFNAGGKIDAPLGNGLELRAGVLISYAFKNTVMIQGLADESKKKVTLSLEKDFNMNASAQLSLQYDFFQLLKLTLLSSEIEYTYGKTQKTYLTLLPEDKEDIFHNSKARSQISSHIKGNHRLNYWLKRVTSLEEKVKRDMTSKFSFLLYGNLKKKATEQVLIIKNGIKKTFYKYYREKKRYIQGLLSRVFSTAVRRIFDFESTIKETSYDKTQLFLEYEKLQNQEMAVDHENQFSYKFTFSTYEEKTHKWYHKRKRSRLIRKIQAWSNLDPIITQKIKDRELVGPIDFSSQFILYENGFIKLNSYAPKEAILKHLKLCGLDESWLNTYQKKSKRRRVYRNNRRNKSHRCTYRLLRSYERYRAKSKKLVNSDMNSSIDLETLSRYLEDLLHYAENKDTLYSILGEENIFIHGSITAKRSGEKLTLTQFFKSGQFRGDGVIERFKDSDILIPLSLRAD